MTETRMVPLMVTWGDGKHCRLRSASSPPAGKARLSPEIYTVRSRLPVDACLLYSLPHHTVIQMISEMEMRPESLMTSNHHQN